RSRRRSGPRRRGGWSWSKPSPSPGPRLQSVGNFLRFLARAGRAPPRSVRDGGGRELRDERIRVEALERKGRDQRRRAAGGDELGECRADDRGRLEAVGPPTRRDVEVLELRPAQDRA